MTVPPRTEKFTSDRYPSDPHHPAGLHSGGRVVGNRHPTEPRAGNPSSSTPTAAIETDPDEDRLSLSATQVVASMAAAVTAAFLGSRLGVAGTVIGAGLASVVTVVGSAVFGHSLLLTRKQVTKAVRQVRHADDRAADAPTAVISTAQANDDRTTLIPAVTRYDLERARLAATAAGSALSGRTGVDPSPGKPKKTRRRIGTHLLVGVAATAAIFAGSLAAVTVVETVKGSPLSGGDSGGLSVLGGNGNTDPGTIPETATTTTEVSTVTSTVTSPTATSAETEPTTSSVATTSPSDDSTPTPSSTPTSPSASSSGITPRTTAQASTDAPSDAN
ncbi:MAG TPA: hypothetical protein VEX40_06760 [Mycobacterium sp.]|nr:hypothetical protein [Mycobacterium sp.]